MTDDTILFRQVHPSFFEEDKPTSQAFYPFPKDNGRLSVDDGDLTTAEDAFIHYTHVLKLASVGTWGLTGAEVVASSLAYGPDPLPDNPAHAYIAFDRHDDKTCRKLAKKLKVLAIARGCLHRA